MFSIYLITLVDQSVVGFILVALIFARISKLWQGLMEFIGS